MSLLKLKTALKTYLTSPDSPSDVSQVVDFINDYVDASISEYKSNVKNNCINFGKWKGMTIKEVCASEKGKDYLTWLLKQSWFSEEKNALLFDDLRTCGVICSLPIDVKTSNATKNQKVIASLSDKNPKDLERKEEKKPRAKKTVVLTSDFPSQGFAKEVEISA